MVSGFPWPDIAAPCSGGDDEGICIDRLQYGEVRATTRQTGVFQHHNDGSTPFLLREAQFGGLFGVRRAVPGPDFATNTQELAISPRNFEILHVRCFVTPS